MRWAKITVEAQPQAEEAIAGVLTDVCGGVSISDGHISAWIPADDRAERAILGVRELLDGLDLETLRIERPSIIVTPVEDDGWTLAYREFFRPVKAGVFWVRPPWETEDDGLAPEGAIPIILDPGMAFGTGHHPTTQMMLEALSETPPRSQQVLDIGAGSGILSVASAKLGASRVVAVEVDPVAEENARLNIEMNGVQELVEYRLQDGPPDERGAFDLALMNIVADVIIRLAPRVFDALRSPGRLICSGVIEERVEEVQERLLACGFVDAGRRACAEWRALAVHKP